MRRLFLILFFLLAVSTVNAFSIDSIYVKQYNRVHYFCSDSVFYKLAHHGFIKSVDDLSDYYEDIFNYLPLDKQLKEISRVRQDAKKYNSSELDIEADYMYALVLPVGENNDISYKIAKMEEVVKKAERQNNMVMKIRAMEAIFNIYWKSSLYAKAFAQTYVIDEQLKNITGEEYPGRGYAYYQIGRAYYFFRNYDKAIPYLRQALKPPKYYFDRSNLLARNAIGSYYNLIGNIDSSEYYFRSAYFSVDNVKMKPVIDAVSLSNIGKCLISRGKPDDAIPYLRAGLNRMLMDNDYELASDVSLELAKSYLLKNDLKKTKTLIDSTQLFIRRTENTDLYQSLYPLMCCYYSKVGNKELALAFFDSTLMINKYFQDKYSSLILLKAEQDLYETKARVMNEDMKAKEDAFKYKIFYGSIIILIISVGLIFSIVLYHRNRMAYRALVYKNQEWASEMLPYASYESADVLQEDDKSEEKAIEEEQPTQEDVALMKEVHELVSKEKIFKNADLTLDLMAKQMSINRNYLSKAINQTTGKNFNTYINEYRVKEAIKILSNEKSDVISIDAIAFDVGFNNRTSFYQSFKKITGLSPSDFRSNKPTV
ncbi:helix-turn-helix domain-containing protein [Dysgonomonas sp. Marseille-Q5470]|uniref:helix-turn-helix domain-containing protein n=1 Tax=Dysgonomonas sp. Marseille-Q5470 TaxID=3039494 RepID=UPI0024BC19D1|nr:helix-turn-helix domain-containing protein [Dysgonomonas sp. Marseille-Q5470]